VNPPTARDLDALIDQALACRDRGDGAGQLAALDRLLAISPGHMGALMMKADHFAAIGDDRAAQAFYNTVATRAPPAHTLPPAVRAQVERARARATHYARAFEAHLREAVARSGTAPSARFAQSIDLLLGKTEIFLQQPTSFYFPELPQRQFYERAEFPWTAALEAQTGAIREELLAVMGEAGAFQPYLEDDPTRPPGEFGTLKNNPDWSAFYLIKGGEVQPGAARCPATMAALEGVPLTDAPGRTPSVLFSLLKPGTRIQPHNGQINARLICHLPLIVPPGCALRVGNETRPWVMGETLIFDDSIEHEAWNDSRETRVVLLFEVWRPELTPAERASVAALLAAVGTYGKV
jgi:aspartyl/asparaginyl beta-hydroxylase (cupin superfamily)